MSITNQAKRLAALYDGLPRAYGRYDTNKEPNPDTGKLEGKALTVREPVTPELWELHVEGVQSIGIVPIDDNGMCSFGAVDIDDYDVDLSSLVKTLGQHGIPMLPLASKSGGWHVTVFFKNKVPAKWLRNQLQAVHKILGAPKSDIFPVQTKLANTNDVGNWINMPYFGDTRKLNGDTKLSMFLDIAENMATTREEWDRLDLLNVASDPMDEAPPCLITFMKDGAPQGTRNKVLFNLAVLHKVQQRAPALSTSEAGGRGYYRQRWPRRLLLPVRRRAPVQRL